MPSNKNTQQLDSPPVGFSQADASAQEKKNIQKRRLLIGGAVVVVLIILAVIATFLLSSTKTITYNNGKGDTFQLQFYSHYTIKAAPSGAGTQELASKVSVNGLYPLVLTIFKGSHNQPSPAIIDCSATGLSSALQITNKSTNKTVNLCSEEQSQSNKPVLYVGIMQSGSTYYTLVFDEDVNYQQLLKGGPATAQAGLQKIDLSPYNSEITTIVSSIKPLQ
jgi:hypothetical protein